jgi:peroxiredoxin Q/BCP
MTFRTRIAGVGIGLAALACASAPVPAQQPAAPAAPRTAPPAVGAIAPDFTLPGATRYGLLSKPASLSDYKGKTVVLAFFFRARTRG